MPLRRRMASWVLARMTTHLFTVSEQSKQLLVSHWGWPAERTNVISNGVDTQQFCPVDGPVRPDSGRIVVGTVGNLRPVKNQAMLVRACGQLARQGVDVELRIAGEGDERAGLLALAEAVGFADRLTLAGRVDDVPGFLRELNIFVLSSDSEQHPNALNEAMACGIASISTRVGCAAELLGEGRFGDVIEPGDESALIDALARSIADPARRNDLAAKGCRHVRENFSMERMAQAYKAMYERVSRARRS